MRGIRALIPALALIVLVQTASAQTLEPFAFSKNAPSGSDLTKAVPAAPTFLEAHPRSNTQITLIWQDNSNNETEFRIEARTGSGAFTDLGSVPANTIGVNVIGLNPSTTYFFRVRARNASGDSAYSNEASATTLAGAGACNASATAMCLNNGRFRVEATFLTPAGQSGAAQTVKLTDDSGYLWFFNAANIEAVVKVLNGCGINNHYWFFAGGLTNVRVAITVTDTQTGMAKTYLNPQNTAFQPIQNTTAPEFATCP